MKSLNLAKGTIILGVMALLYVLIIIAKSDEPNGSWRIAFLVALVAGAAASHLRRPEVFFGALALINVVALFSSSGGGGLAARLVSLTILLALGAFTYLKSSENKMGLPTFFKWVHLFLAVLYFWGAAFGKWAKRGDPDEGVLSADGGTGFGIVAVVIGVALLVLAVMRLAGKSKVLPGLGVEQLTVILGLAAWMNILAFVVGWLATFEAGTGWGVVVAYFPASLIPQLGAITLAATEPATTIKPLDEGLRTTFSVVALLAGIGVALFPFLAWITSGSVSLSALDGRSEGSLSGPRFGYMLLIFGAVIAVAALMRLRPGGLAEPGPNALIGHAVMAAGLVTFAVPLATLLSILRHDANLSAGIGLWLTLLAGAVLIGIAFAENQARGAVAA